MKQTVWWRWSRRYAIIPAASRCIWWPSVLSACDVDLALLASKWQSQFRVLRKTVFIKSELIMSVHSGITNHGVSRLRKTK